MSVRHRLRQVLVAVAVTAVAAIVPTAAYAAPPPPLAFTVHDGGVPEAGKWFSLSLHATDGSTSWRLDHAKLVIDTSAVAGFATAWVANFDEEGEPKPADYCHSAGPILTCDLVTVYSWGLPSLVVEAKPGAEVGTSGKLAVTLTGDGIDPLVATPKITVADDVDLAVTVAAGTTSARPGEPVIAPIVVTNTGTKPVAGAALRIVAFDGLQRFGDYSNCGYDRGDQEMYCRFDTELAPGASYVLGDAPVAVRADATPGEAAGYLAMLFTGDDFDEDGGFNGLTKGSNGVLGLIRKQLVAQRAPVTDSNGANNLTFGHVNVFDVPGGSGSPSAPASSGTVPPRGSAGGGGGLPITGLPIGAVAGVGAGLLALGGAGFLLARRRRARFVA